MKPIKYSTLVFLLVALSSLFSCQKVINIDLNSGNPILVVDASMSNIREPYYVKLSKTVNFDDISVIPPVLGAYVEISDSLGNSETLTEVKDGIYKTNSLRGIPGQTYKLTIKTEGQTYEAISIMPLPADSLKLSIVREVQKRPSVGGGGGGGGEKKIRYQVNYEIKDPEKYKNYYRFVAYYKKRELSSRRVFDDQFHNGKTIIDEFGLNDSATFAPGDTIVIQLQNIDKGTYNFYRTLRDGGGGLGFLSASPSNPITNISNNAVGVFNAYSLKVGFVVIPKQ